MISLASLDRWKYLVAVWMPALIQFGSILLFTRLFDADAYGQFTLAVAAAGLWSGLMMQWLTQAIQRYRPAYRTAGALQPFDAHLTSLLLRLLLATAAGAGAVYALSLLWFEGYGLWFGWTLLLGISQGLYMVMSIILNADRQADAYRSYQLTQALLRLGLALLIIYGIAFHVGGLIWGMAISYVVLLPFMMRRTGLLRSRTIRATEGYHAFQRQMLAYGMPMAVWFAAGTVLDLGDRFLLAWLSDHAAVGIYGAYYSLISAAIGFVAFPLLAAATPVLMQFVHEPEQTEEAISKLNRHLSRPFLLMAIPCCSYLTLFHVELGNLLFAPGYAEGAVVIPPLALGFFLWHFSMYGHKGLEIRERTLAMAGYAGTAAVTGVLANIWLIPDCGYYGAALSTLIGFGVYALLIYVDARRPGRISWLIPWRTLTVSVVLSVLLAGAFYYFNVYWLTDTSPWLVMAVEGVVGAVLYGAACLGLGELRWPSRLKRSRR